MLMQTTTPHFIATQLSAQANLRGKFAVHSQSTKPEATPASRWLSCEAAAAAKSFHYFTQD